MGSNSSRPVTRAEWTEYHTEVNRVKRKEYNRKCEIRKEKDRKYARLYNQENEKRKFKQAEQLKRATKTHRPHYKF